MPSAQLALVHSDHRRCSGCGEAKEAGAFSVDRGRSSGLASKCRECQRKRKNRENAPRFHVSALCAECRAGHKFCGKCRQHKARGDFQRDAGSKDGLHGWCRVCSRAAKAHPAPPRPCVVCGESFQPARNGRGLTCSAAACVAEQRRRAYRRVLLNRYDLSLPEYDALLKKQGGACAICRSVATKSKAGRELFVDHDHDSGVIRGLLCHHCNSAIGQMDDDVDRLYRAAEYLATHKGIR